MDWDRELRSAEGDGASADPPPPEPPRPSDEDDGSLIDRSARLPLNDYGNGQRLVLHFGDDLMFVPRLGWFVWNGKVWAQDFDGMGVRRVAHKIPSLIAEEATRRRFSDRDAAILKAAREGEAEYQRLLLLPELDEAQTGERTRLRDLLESAAKVKARDAKLRAEHARFAKSAGNTSKITNMLLEAEPYVERRVDALNTDSMVANCETGTLAFGRDREAEQWTEGQAWRVDLRPHRREDMITKLMPVEFDPAAKCPDFDAFLARIQPEMTMRAFLQRWFGYSLTGLTNEQKLVFFHGAGRNGKSTLVDIVARIIGDYATSVPIESLTGTEQRKGSDATPDLVRVIGARMVRASEPEEGIRFKEATVKSFTGSEPLLIRKMREEFVEIDPIFKLTISGNHKPNVRGTDDGIWRRILLVPFAVQIPRDEVDPLLPKKLWDERTGVLNWLLEGARQFLAGGLQEPAEVLDATAEFRDDSDPVRTFLLDCCTVTGDAGDFEVGRDLTEAFQVWQKDQGGAPWGARTVSLRFSEKAGVHTDPKTLATYSKRKTAATSGYAGIALRSEMRARLDEVRRGHAGGDRRGDDEEFV
ncbi:MAG: phage/plasmid primase, P4 family [Amaricoccus sp.]|uniref:DNA primase family protein n=1 Tax=Amaricoccus sp. TaxID=1872485 RepID=UPI0039E6110D